LSTSHLYWI